MIKSTLCYLQKDGCYLMLYRNKKKNDINAGKWVGVGGKFEPGESAEECLVREVREETGIELLKYDFLGVIEFRNDICEDEDMYLYLGREFAGSGSNGVKAEDKAEFDCNEGELKWIPKSEILSLNLWEGDRYFLEPMLEGKEKISLRLVYSGDRLIEKLSLI